MIPSQPPNKQLKPQSPSKPQPTTVIITNIEHKQNQSKTHDRSQSHLPSQLIVKTVLSTILRHAKQQLFENNCLRNKMTKYSGHFAHQYTKQTVRMQFDQNQLEKPFKDDPEPNPLRSDNLIPVGTNLEPNNFDKISKKSIQQTTLGKFPRNSTIVSRSQKQLSLVDPKNTTKVSSYIKLNEEDLPKYQVTTDPFVEEMRRLKEAKLKENQQNKKVQKKTNLRDIIKKDEKISYDFSGEIIKIKPIQKNNFASSSVEGLENPALAKKEKQPKIDSNPINLDIGTRKGIDKKALSKKALDIEFSNIVSLTPQLQILQGVKFIHGKSVLQKKKKQASIGELKKTISTKRFTRNDFERLKSLGDNRSVRGKGDSLPSIVKSETEINDRNESILGRSVSEAKFEDRSRFSTKNRLDKSQDKMSIENQELTDMLLQPVHNAIEDDMILRAPESTNQQQSKVVALNHIDKGNLNFIKTGSVGKVELPKISYRIAPNQTLKQPHAITLLQSKTKLKGKRKQNQFQRLRKHFEDKLRT